MLNLDYNYFSNIFFHVNNYFVYLLNPQNTLKYNFYFENNNYFIQINNKVNQPLNIKFKIITINNKCYYYTIYRNRNNLIKLTQFHKLVFNNKHRDIIFINEKVVDYISKQYPNFNIKQYNQNLFNLELNESNHFFLKYNWFYYGRFNKYQYWKYIIYKNNTF